MTRGIHGGPAARRGINPADWRIFAPRLGYDVALTIVFDRVMGIGITKRLLRLRDSEDSALRGEINSDGGGWFFSTTQALQAGT